MRNRLLVVTVVLFLMVLSAQLAMGWWEDVLTIDNEWYLFTSIHNMVIDSSFEPHIFTDGYGYWDLFLEWVGSTDDYYYIEYMCDANWILPGPYNAGGDIDINGGKGVVYSQYGTVSNPPYYYGDWSALGLNFGLIYYEESSGGYYPKIAIGDNYHIIFDKKYLCGSVEDLDENFSYKDIDVDSNNIPHIMAYRDGDIYQMYKEDSIWYVELILENSSGNQIIIDPNDRINTILTSSGIKYHTYKDSEWHYEEIPNYITIDEFDVDSNGHLHIVDAHNGIITYSYYDGNEWVIIDIEPPDFWGSVHIDVDSCNRPYIAYNYTDMNIKCIRWEKYPSQFNLLSPHDGDFVSSTPTLDWEDSTDDETVTYDLWYATKTCFEPHYEVNDLSESTYTFSEGELTEGEIYYWKVKATDGEHDTWSGPDDYWAFKIIPPFVDSAFWARGGEGKIILNWSMSSVVDRPVSCFKIYRREIGEKSIIILEGDETDWIEIGLVTYRGKDEYIYIDDSVDTGTTYEYKLEAVVEDEPDIIGTTTGICGLPAFFTITSIHPNPAVDSVSITLSTPHTTDVRIEVYDISGRLVKTEVIGEIGEGEHTEMLSTSDLSSGVYTVKAISEDTTATDKMVLVR
jgi:hypothetical protein